MLKLTRAIIATRNCGAPVSTVIRSDYMRRLMQCSYASQVVQPLRYRSETTGSLLATKYFYYTWIIYLIYNIAVSCSILCFGWIGDTFKPHSVIYHIDTQLMHDSWFVGSTTELCDIHLKHKFRLARCLNCFITWVCDSSAYAESVRRWQKHVHMATQMHAFT